jgi:hypothetical protein
LEHEFWGCLLGAMSHNLTRLLWLRRIQTTLDTAGAPRLSLGFLREHGVASFVWRKETLITWRYLFSMNKTERLGTGQPVLGNQGPGFVYMKLGETREVWISFMKPGRLEWGHCFPGIEILLAMYNFLLCIAYKPDAKMKNLSVGHQLSGSLDLCLICSFLSWVLSGQEPLQSWQLLVRNSPPGPSHANGVSHGLGSLVPETVISPWFDLVLSKERINL